MKRNTCISFLYFYNEQWINFSFSINFIEYNMYLCFRIQLFLQRYIHPKIYLFVNIYSIIFQVLMSSCIIIYNPIILWKSTISQHIKVYYAIFLFNNYFLFKMKETHIYYISFLYFYNEQWISFSFSINFIIYNMHLCFRIISSEIYTSKDISFCKHPFNFNLSNINIVIM